MEHGGEEASRRRIHELEREVARERDRLRALQDIGTALACNLDLDDLNLLVATRVAELLECERATLYVLDEDQGELAAKLGHTGEAPELRLRLGEGLPGWAARSGQPLHVVDAYQDVRFKADSDRLTGVRTHTVLCVPMKNHHGRIIGILEAGNKHRGHFTPDDERMLVALAAQAAVSLENSKLFLSVVNKNMELLETKEQLEQKVREQDVLFEIAQVSATAPQLDSLLEGVLARTMHAIGAEAGSVLLADEFTGDLHFRCAVGGEPEKVKRLRIRAGEGVSGWVARHGEAQVVNDVERDPRHSVKVASQTGYHPRSVLCVPLRLENGVGALELLNKEHGLEPFTADDLKLASVIGGHVSTAIRLAQARERRRRQERLSTIGQLLSSVMHDLKAPMTIISGYAKLLGNEADVTARRGFADSIVKQIEIINAMTREVLAFARGDTQVWVRRVYVAQFFRQLVEQLEMELAGRGVEVKLELRYRGVARFDENKLQRAIHNLARNAAQALAKQGGTFLVRVEQREDDGALVISCIDDGPGVPEAIRERMFESFTSHGDAGGTGLGLAIVRKIIDDHGGSIGIETRPGFTRISLVLPQPAQDAEPDTSRAETALSPQGEHA